MYKPAISIYNAFFLDWKVVERTPWKVGEILQEPPKLVETTRTLWSKKFHWQVMTVTWNFQQIVIHLILPGHIFNRMMLVNSRWKDAVENITPLRQKTENYLNSKNYTAPFHLFYAFLWWPTGWFLHLLWSQWCKESLMHSKIQSGIVTELGHRRMLCFQLVFLTIFTASQRNMVWNNVVIWINL